MKDFKEAAERYAATFINVTNINDRDNICKDFIAGAEYGYSESVKEVSREGEPSTQAGEEQLDGLLKSQLRELAERRKKDYDRLADSFERLKQENERLKGSIDRVKDRCSSEMSNYIAVKDVLQALNPKD